MIGFVMMPSNGHKTLRWNFIREIDETCMKEGAWWLLHSKLNLSDLPSILLLVFFYATTCFVVLATKTWDFFLFLTIFHILFTLFEYTILVTQELLPSSHCQTGSNMPALGYLGNRWLLRSAGKSQYANANRILMLIENRK